MKQKLFIGATVVLSMRQKLFIVATIVLSMLPTTRRCTIHEPAFVPVRVPSWIVAWHRLQSVVSMMHTQTGVCATQLPATARWY